MLHITDRPGRRTLIASLRGQAQQLPNCREHAGGTACSGGRAAEVGDGTLPRDPTRARLLYALDVAEELCVGDLALALAVSEDAASYGLRVLRTAGLVTRRKQGRVAYYRLSDGFPESLRQHCLRQLIEMSRTPDNDDM